MKVGFIGLGIMGKPMCHNLIKAGYELVVMDKDTETVKAFETLASVAQSPEEVASAVEEVIITMLPNSPHVKEVILGDNGILAANRKGLTVIDMSSISPIVSREICSELEKAGMDILDAPVSGGEPKAIEGTLSVMVGGKKDVFEKYYDLMKAMAGSVVRVGETGAGNIAKLCNQIIVALNISAVSEALTFAQKAGVSPELVYNAIRGGLAGSTVLDAKAPLMMNRQFDPGFRIDLHIKDMNNVLEASHNLGIPLPLSATVMEMMQSLKSDGLGNEDHSGLIKYYEKIANLTLGR
ncbi:MAG: 2-hydroxy-3-oxopropionate reductase [Tannerella sp.]|jgi:2-hydroxy-3-oxopropionate reductase|nr:2-hydroxy-3-oxopropionate reductase [Tannerella sp.]